MNHNEILNKNEICYCLLSSFNEPNILLPCRCIIKDIKIDYEQPVYLVKIDKLYDVIDFIKDYLYNMYFYNKFEQSHKIKLSLEQFDTTDKLNIHLFNNDYQVIVHSLMVFDTKVKMLETFDKLNTYFIKYHIFNLKNAITRKAYKGKLKMSLTEFEMQFEKFVSDKINQKECEQLLYEVENTKPIGAMKYEDKDKKYINKRIKRRKEKGN